MEVSFHHLHGDTTKTFVSVGVGRQCSPFCGGRKGFALPLSLCHWMASEAVPEEERETSIHPFHGVGRGFVDLIHRKELSAFQ